MRKFHIEAANAPNTGVLNVSMDLPFAQKHFWGAEDKVLYTEQVADISSETDHEAALKAAR